MRLKAPITNAIVLVVILAILFLAWVVPTSHAASSTWLASPAGNDWDNSANWISNTDPNGPGQIATFGATNTAAIAVTANTEVDSVIFNPGASIYTITTATNATLTIDGAGIVNNSGVAQTFVATGMATSNMFSFTPHAGIAFGNSATAGNASLIADAAATSHGSVGAIAFTGSSNAGTSSITDLGSAFSYTTDYGGGGFTYFAGNSSAGNAHVTVAAGTATNGFGGTLLFSNSASAGSGIFSIQGGSIAGAFGGFAEFNSSSDTAGNSSFTVGGGTVNGAFGGSLDFSGGTAGNASFFLGGGTVFGAEGCEINFSGAANSGTATFNIAAGEGGASGEDPGTIVFTTISSASHGTFTNNGATVNGGFGGQTIFQNHATAGSALITASGGVGSNGGGFIQFTGTSTGANGTFILAGGTSSGLFGPTLFFQNISTSGSGTYTLGGGAGGASGSDGAIAFFQNDSDAGQSTFTNNGGTVSGGFGGQALFQNYADADQGTFTNNGATVNGGIGGRTLFQDSSFADSAVLIANGGAGSTGGGFIQFSGSSQGNTSRIEVFGNGALDISAEASGLGVSIGSMEGTGKVFLGANTLTTGSNNLSTTFSGNILDSGTAGGTGGSLVKTGTGRLIVSGSCGYTGSTTVNGGELRIDGSINSNTEIASGGLLSGTGTILALTLDNGGILAPGDDSVGGLTASSLTWNGGGVQDITLGPGSNFLQLGGALTKGTAGSFVFDFSNGGVQVGQTYIIGSATSTTFNTSDFSFTDNFGLAGTFSTGLGSINGGPFQGLLEFKVTAAIPEPDGTPSMLLGLGMVCFAGRSLQRRVRRD